MKVGDICDINMGRFAYLFVSMSYQLLKDCVKLIKLKGDLIGNMGKMS
jgi:hypothetical protein